MNVSSQAADRPGPGVLWLIPTPLGEASSPKEVLPPSTLAILQQLDFLIAERARTARAVLRQCELARPIQQIEILELNEHTPDSALPDLLGPVLGGRDAGLMSEAGCPAVADPGARLVALAHRLGVRVCPLVGPSSLLLALMASGLNGQSFAFTGYLPQDARDRKLRIETLEARSAQEGQTQLFIETPYRNQAIFDALCDHLAPPTQLLVASDLTLPEQNIQCRPVLEWRQTRPTLSRTPTVFGLLAERRQPQRSRSAQPQGRDRR